MALAFNRYEIGGETRFRFPRPFAGKVRMVGLTNGLPSLLVEGAWSLEKVAYRYRGSEGQTLIVPIHYFREGGLYYEYAVLDHPQEGQILLYWVRFTQ